MTHSHTVTTGTARPASGASHPVGGCWHTEVSGVHVQKPFTGGVIQCQAVEDGSGRRFVLRRPVAVRVEFESGFWTYECPKLQIVAYADTRLGARAAFASDFSAFWDLIAQESDDCLAADALEVKKVLLDLVERTVPPAGK